ncbi:MAG: T9SS type A sorting domain-containing protein [Saprospiraceae bacterium]|nr:T9SS type A sorting domain-containing protein [Saprospiraceae bacterium]
MMKRFLCAGNSSRRVFLALLLCQCMGSQRLAAQWQLLPAEPSFLAIKPLDSLRIWAIRQGPNSGSLQSFFSNNSGGSWSAGAPLPLSDGFLLGVSFAAPDAQNLWVSHFHYSTGNDLLHKSADAGQSWQPVARPAGAGMTNLIHFWTRDTGILIARNLQTDLPFDVFRTTNGGASWTKTPAANFPASTNFEYVSTAAEHQGALWIFTSKSQIYKTANRGASWTTGAQLPEEPIYGSAMAFADQQTGMLRITGLGARSSIWKTTNGGSNWTEIAHDGLPLQQMKTLRGVVPVPGMPGHWIAGTSKGAAYTRDGGATWTRMSTLTNYDFANIWFVSANRAFGASYLQKLALWSGPLGDPACVRFLGPVESKVYQDCYLRADLTVRADISADTNFRIGLKVLPPPAANQPQSFIANLRENNPDNVEFSPEPGTPHIGTLRFKTTLNRYPDLDSTQAVPSYQFFPTSCETDTTEWLSVRPGFFYIPFHRECFQIDIDTALCTATLRTNLCGYDTNSYAIRHYFPNINPSPPWWTSTGAKFTADHTPLNEYITFYIIRGNPDDFPGYSICFDTLVTHLVCGTSGTGEAPSGNWDIWPNPTRDLLHLQAPIPESVDVQIYSAEGQLQWRGAFHEQTQIDTADWPEGIYLLSGRTRTGPLATRKIVVLHR